MYVSDIKGEVAGRLTSKGYIYMKVDRRGYMAHRLVFLHVTGRWPRGQIDHINGDRADNRFDNLREATQSENSQNQRTAKRSNLSSGLLGVTWAPKLKKWVAQIMIEGDQNRLGSFDTPELAHAAYCDAKRRLHPYGML